MSLVFLRRELSSRMPGRNAYYAAPWPQLAFTGGMYRDRLAGPEGRATDYTTNAALKSGTIRRQDCERVIHEYSEGSSFCSSLRCTVPVRLNRL